MRNNKCKKCGEPCFYDKCWECLKAEQNALRKALTQEDIDEAMAAYANEGKN